MTIQTDVYKTYQRNARIAGFAFLFYIVVGIQRAPTARIDALFNMLMCFSALVLAVMLYAITRDQDRDLAMLGLVCRVAEGVVGAMFIPLQLGLHTFMADTTNTTNPETLHTLEAYLASAGSWNPTVSAIFFGVGSLLFAWLMLRGRLIPVPLAWLGVLASVWWVVGLPLQLINILPKFFTWFIYLPMAAFEIPLGFWLLIKGVAVPSLNVVSSHATVVP